MRFLQLYGEEALTYQIVHLGVFTSRTAIVDAVSAETRRNTNEQLKYEVRIVDPSTVRDSHKDATDVVIVDINGLIRTYGFVCVIKINELQFL